MIERSKSTARLIEKIVTSSEKKFVTLENYHVPLISQARGTLQQFLVKRKLKILLIKQKVEKDRKVINYS